MEHYPPPISNKSGCSENRTHKSPTETTSCLERHWLFPIRLWLSPETAQEQLLGRALDASSDHILWWLRMPYGCTVETSLGTLSVLGVWISNPVYSTFFWELSNVQTDFEAMGFVLLLHGCLFPRFNYFSSSCFLLLLKMMQTSMREGSGKQSTAWWYKWNGKTHSCLFGFLTPLTPQLLTTSPYEIEVVKFLFIKLVCVHAENIVNIFHLIFTVYRV